MKNIEIDIFKIRGLTNHFLVSKSCNEDTLKLFGYKNTKTINLDYDGTKVSLRFLLGKKVK